MCGICGKYYFDEGRKPDEITIRQMMTAMNHRGPDGEGVYLSKQIGFGHKRLSIIDLSTGKQPLSNEDGTVWIVFNGEIYNYQELTKDLVKRGHRFATVSDTEVIVHAYEEYGVACLQLLRGMFAFAIWDEKKRCLFVARDRVGIKPLYYATTKDGVIFSSEIKAILRDPSVKPEVDPRMIDRFLTYLYMPGEDTLIKGIYKLKPGNFLSIQDGQLQTEQYWDLNFSPANTFRSEDDLKAGILDLLKESVRLHMISDVPVGFLLSGGVDSTAMVGLAAEGTNRNLNTFTIGFEDQDFEDERVYARLAATKYGTKHYETTISCKDFCNFIPEYVYYMEEPVCEPPAIALYYISKLAKEYVKVLISGEGGDEAFAGYHNYRNFLWIERLKRILGPAGSLVSLLSSDLFARLPGYERMQNNVPFFSEDLRNYYYSRNTSPFSYFNSRADYIYTHDFKKQCDKAHSLLPTSELLKTAAHLDDLSRMLYVDTKTWLPDDLFIKADKMTMANSVELRVPLLDHKLLEYAASIPGSYKVRGMDTKYILKQTLSKLVPRQIIERKKAGFPVPYEKWLRTGMRDYVKDLLLDGKTTQRGYFEKKEIEELIQNNETASQHNKEIFSLLVLELWHRIFVDSEPNDRNMFHMDAAGHEGSK